MSSILNSSILDKRRKVGSIGQLLRASFLSGFGGGGTGAGALPFALPEGVLTPPVWFSPHPDHVERNESGGITKILNIGTGGSIYDATPDTANLMTIEQDPFWGDRYVFVSNPATTGGYTMGTHLQNAHTVMGIATYKDGLESTFDGYNAIWSGAVGPSGSTENELVGHQARPSFYPNFLQDLFVDGVLGASNVSVLPMNKKRLTHRIDLLGRNFGMLFRDNFGTSRRWQGRSGCILGWDSMLTDTQIISSTGIMGDYYAAPA